MKKIINVFIGTVATLLSTIVFANTPTSWSLFNAHEVIRIANEMDREQILTVKTVESFLILNGIRVHANAVRLNCASVMQTMHPGSEAACVLPARKQAELTLIMNTKYPSSNWGARGTYQFSA